MSVIFSRKSRRSGAALAEALAYAGYNGPTINFGYAGAEDRINMLNHPDAVANAVNKRLALQMMTDAGVPTLYFDHEQGIPQYPVIARPDYHHAGKWLHLCHNFTEIGRAFSLRRRGGQASIARATHTQVYLPDAREFRVHVLNGKSIKMSEKVGSGNHTTGAIFEYPHEFEYKKQLRAAAKCAVACLGLDFGAVDLLHKDGESFVLEVNTAPRLTDENSDTLDVYVRAFRNL